MGGENSIREWILDNILFLLPDSRTEDVNSKPFGSKNIWNASNNKKGVKPYVPGYLKNKCQNFIVQLLINETYQTHHLNLKVQPEWHLNFEKMNGRPFIPLFISDIINIERIDKRLDITFRDKSDRKQRLLVFFIDNNDCEEFCEVFTTIYSKHINVLRSEDLQENLKKGLSQILPPLHFIKQSKFNASYNSPKFNYYSNTDNTQENIKLFGQSNKTFEKLINEDDISIIYSEGFPISFKGSLESGSCLSLEELGDKSKVFPPTLIEWFLSDRPGNLKEFPKDATHQGSSFLLTDIMVGHYIELRVTRKIDIEYNKSEYIDSIAKGGPITISSEMSRLVLTYIVKSRICIEILMDTLNTNIIYEESLKSTKISLENLLLHESELEISPNGIDLYLKPKNSRFHRPFNWDQFFISRTSSFNKDYNHEIEFEENLRLFFFTSSLLSGKLTCSVMRLPSQEQRNAIYHLICFYRMQTKITGFQNLHKDLETGNISSLKKVYSSLWKKTNLEKLNVILDSSLST